MGVVVLAGMWVGNFTCGMPAFDLELYCQKMAEYKATWTHIVPPVAVALANSDIAAKYDLSSLKMILISAAPTKKALQTRLKARFGADTRIVQGETRYLCFRPDVALTVMQDMACPNARPRSPSRAHWMTRTISEQWER